MLTIISSPVNCLEDGSDGANEAGPERVQTAAGHALLLVQPPQASEVAAQAAAASGRLLIGVAVEAAQHFLDDLNQCGSSDIVLAERTHPLWRGGTIRYDIHTWWEGTEESGQMWTRLGIRHLRMSCVNGHPMAWTSIGERSNTISAKVYPSFITFIRRDVGGGQVGYVRIVPSQLS